MITLIPFTFWIFLAALIFMYCSFGLVGVVIAALFMAAISFH